MKTIHPKPLLRAGLLGLAATCVALSSCATSSDPTQGGIFWSESGSQQRLRDREALLYNIRQNTADTEARNQQIESKIQQQR